MTQHEQQRKKRETLWAKASLAVFSVFILSGFVSLFASTTLQAEAQSGPCVAISPAVTGHWSFDEAAGVNVADSSGNSYNGTLYNSGGMWVSGSPTITGNGGALSFDGTDDHVAVNSSSAFNFGSDSFTVSLFAKTATGAGSGNRGVLGNYNSGKGWGLYFYESNAVNFFAYGAGGVNDAAKSATVMDGQWHHVAGVFTKVGSTMTIDTYVDGVFRGSNAAVVGDISSNSALHFGHYVGQPNFHGKLDEIRVYGSALTSAQIGALAAGCSGAGNSSSSVSSSSSMSSSNGNNSSMSSSNGNSSSSGNNSSMSSSNGNNSSMSSSNGNNSSMSSSNGNNSSMSSSNGGNNSSNGNNSSMSSSNSNGGNNSSMSSSTSSTGSCSSINATGAAYWKFNEGAGYGAMDSTAHDNHAWLWNGATWSSDAAPTSYSNGYSLDLDGSNDYASVADISGIPSGSSARTIALWVKPDVIHRQGVLVSLGNGSVTGQKFILMLGTEPAAGPVYLFSDGVYGANNITIAGAQVPVVDQWNHVAFSVDASGNWKYYLNGVMQKSGKFVVNMNTNVNTVEIGSRHDLATGYFDGKLDDVRIYASALSAADISNLAGGCGDSGNSGGNSSSSSYSSSNGNNSSMSSSNGNNSSMSSSSSNGGNNSSSSSSVSSSSSSSVSSSSSSSVGNVPTCNGVPATIYVRGNRIVGGPMNGQYFFGILRGTNGDDVIVGTSGNDIIGAKNGSDLICGQQGSDFIYGDEGRDTIYAGPGSNVVFGNEGQDTIYADNGNNVLFGNQGNDTIRAGNGSDFIDGGQGRDSCNGGGGYNTVIQCE